MKVPNVEVSTVEAVVPVVVVVPVVPVIPVVAVVPVVEAEWAIQNSGVTFTSIMQGKCVSFQFFGSLHMVSQR